jgi:hypothetical protein
MNITATCQEDVRREPVRSKLELNGLDYLEVGDDYITLTVYFLGKAPQPLKKGTTQYVRIEGGRSIRNIRVIDLDVVRDPNSELDDYAIVSIDKYGDFSTYTLRLVGLENIDPFYDHLEFSFKVNCPSDLDCAPADTCPQPDRVEPEINYLAKDYASFRQLILDRLALIMPDWQERHVPDLGITLVELLAYVGDYLSYHQDAVATEAYLDTARQRISVRRHARLVDYLLHEGCNARTWLCITTDNDLTGEHALNPREVYFITSLRDMAVIDGAILSMDDLRNVPPSAYEPFEAMTDQPIELYVAHIEIHFYSWGERECCLPKGSTSATLADALDTPPTDQLTRVDESPRKLHLKIGDVLIFEEVLGPVTGQAADADPGHRHVVRLTKVTPGIDLLNGQPIIEVHWSREDELPFPLCLSAMTDAEHGCKYQENISIARGNVILVDHGFTIEPNEKFGTVPTATTETECDCEDHPVDVRYFAGCFRPRLKEMPLTYRQPLPPDYPAKNMIASAASWLRQDVHQALPQAYLTSILPQTDGGSRCFTWLPQVDLLGSGPNDWHFVVETDNDGVAWLRFGDGECGQQPEAASAFYASYRVGKGASGNVGADSISHLVFRHEKISGSNLTVSNPFPARGGMSAEPMAEAKLFAPSAFRDVLMRAVIAKDYADLAQREFSTKIDRAAAVLAWTGSWYEAGVTIDPSGSEEASPELLRDIEGVLQLYRRMGHDLKVDSARYVPIDLELTVRVLPHFQRGHVKAALMDIFSNRVLPDGRLGFFHPDKLSFGEGVYLSCIVAAAQAVTGVESVCVTKLTRLLESPNRELANGVLPLGPFEVAQLDNDPSFPEQGKLTLVI